MKEHVSGALLRTPATARTSQTVLQMHALLMRVFRDCSNSCATTQGVPGVIGPDTLSQIRSKAQLVLPKIHCTWK